SLGVVMIDIDHFKSINDTYGHPAGDCVLREVARAMRSMIRTYDSAGRYGGEEFMIVLPGCNEITAVSHAERLRKSLSSLAVAAEQGEIRFTASFGVAVASRDSGLNNAEDLIQAADEALYRAKHQGRNRVELADVLTTVS